MKIRITKEFNFETAHALDGYNGKCKDIHGHSYHLKITFLGEPENDKNVSECGMVEDFAVIKKIVNESVYDLFDHRLILRNDSRFKSIEKNNERIRYVDYQPTCENMLIEIVKILKARTPEYLLLCKVHLRETSNNYAEWCAEDNQRS